ncbi:MAG TPA: HAMP domain-containing sensor histidine kinase [Polyangiaceae bacterium]|jgi:signal transduction histidine kinase|nr:HAMP domain-containing sensor histidine kinase [Polyangiaceae bacterium]
MSERGVTARLWAGTKNLKASAVPRKAGGLPFLPIVPAIIVIVGIAAGAAILRFGIEQLREQNDRSTAVQSRILTLTLGERLRATPHSGLPPDVLTRIGRAGIGQRMREHPDVQFNQVIARAADRSGAEFLLVDESGEIVVDETDQAPAAQAILALERHGNGETSTVHGRAHFYAMPLESRLAGLWLIGFVTAAETPSATQPLVSFVAAFTLMLVGVAAFVAYYLARSVHADVSFLRDRVMAMTALDSAPGGQPVVVRGVDQVGQLTVAFNRLIERFYSAEEAYRRDLSGALSYERERSDFLAALSHELRTPLNVILGFADVLLSEVDGPLSAEARENLLVVRQSGSHLRSLINDILDLSALETGRLNLQLKKTNLWSIAADVVRESRVAAEAKDLSIEIQGEAVEAIADQLRIRQVLGNLVSNAVKFTSRGGVVVSVGKAGDHATLSVKDTGPGIAKEEQAAVFEEYRQSGDWQARGAGSGLGLAITRRLVRMHGGRIELESKLGEGSRFSVLLPIAGPPDADAAPQQPDIPRGNTLRLSADLARSIER